MGAEITRGADDEDVHDLGARLFCFLWILAQVFDRALRASWLLSHTDAPAVILHQMAKTHALSLTNDFREVGFDLIRIGFCGKTQALCEAHHVGIDANGLFAEGVAEDNIRGLAPDAGQADEVCQIVGYPAAEALDELFTTIVN